MRLTIVVAAALAALGPASAAEPVRRTIELTSERIGVLGLPLAESARPVFRVGLTAAVDERGEGGGVLTLDLTGLPAYDEFGAPTAFPPAASLKLDCILKFVKLTTVKVAERMRPGAPEPPKVSDQEWRLYSIVGPKISSRLFLARPTGITWVGRLVVQGGDGQVKYVVDFQMPPQPEPCHPGCFPAGTPIRLPAGTAPVETVRAGDTVATVGPDGTMSHGTVASVFTTTNRLIAVRTDAGTLLTTETQPLALADGGLRAAGELKAGDRIWRHDGRARRPAAVVSVSAAGREERVFNLVLADTALFVADGYLARSKPPAEPVPPR